MAKERDKENMFMVKYKANHKCKDEYIYHLTFLLESHLSLLPSKVVDEIGVSVIPTER